MKKIALILFLFYPMILHARLQGQARMDSLLKELPQAKEDTNKVKLLISISFAIKETDPDKGIKYGETALSLSQKLEWEKGIAQSYNTIANNYDNKSDFLKGIDNNLRALHINEQLSLKYAVADITGSIANEYLAQGNNAKALEYFLKVLKTEEELNNKSGMALSLVGIGSVYCDLKDYSKALENYFSALKKFEELNDKQNIAMCLYNIGTTYCSIQNFLLSLENDLKALKIFEDLGDKFGLMAATMSAGHDNTLMHNYAKGLEYEFKGLQISEEIGSKEYSAAALKDIGETYLKIATDTTGQIGQNRLIPTGKQANLNNAIKHLERSLIIAKEVNIMNSVMDDQELLAEAYRQSGNYKAAFENYEAYTKTKDSVFSTDNKITIANLETKREADLKEKQIQINKQAVIQGRNERVIFASGALLLLAVIAGVYVNYRNQRKTNRLQEKMLEQKELLMKEIHHRVKNNLQVISTLLDLQMGGITDEGTKDAITESNSRLKAISLIHQQLYQEEHITTIEFAKFVTDLHTQVSAVFNKTGRQVAFNNDIPNTLLDIDTSVPLGLALNELMTNSYKYAFDNTSGSISVRSEKVNDGYRVIYKDSGPGLPAGVDLRAIKTLGMRLLHGLSKQLAGTFSYAKEANEFIITFKDIAGRKMID